MFPEEFTKVHRLALLCSPNELNQFAKFVSVSSYVAHQWPTVTTFLFMLKDNQYGLYSVHSELNADRFLSLTPMPDYAHLVERLRQCRFDAAIVLTAPHQSPFSLAYLCYLAEIPIRLGQSQEFGGGVLSHCIHPPSDLISVETYNLHLLKSFGLLSSANNSLTIV
jgi:ADP-heptose:LPS heptosyltransferase